WSITRRRLCAAWARRRRSWSSDATVSHKSGILNRFRIYGSELRRMPGDLFFTINADANPAISRFLAFILNPATRCATHLDVQRGESGASAGDVVVPWGLVAIQVQAVPLAHSLRQPGYRH